MKVTKLFHDKATLTDGSIVEMTVWQLAEAACMDLNTACITVALVSAWWVTTTSAARVTTSI